METDSEKTDCRSLVALQEMMERAHTEENIVEYQEMVLDYASEWQSVVTQRVDKALKEVKKLQQTRRHYESKVEGLRKRVNQLEAKDKEVPESLGEKLTRNEGKLRDAFEVHELEAGKLCILIEHVTQEGWHNLKHLIENALEWEMNRLARENAIYNDRNVSYILEGMKR